MRDLRCWLLTDGMAVTEFMESFNTAITHSQNQSYNFPGVSIETQLKRNNTPRYPLLVDELATISSCGGQTQVTIFIEVRRKDLPWLFTLDCDDESRFYKSVTQATTASNGIEVSASPMAVQVLQAMPYLSF